MAADERPMWKLSPKTVIALCMLAGYGLSHMEVSKWYSVAVTTVEALGGGFGSAFYNTASIALEIGGTLSGFELILTMVCVVSAAVILLLGMKLLIFGRLKA